jgi:hypothetical protein
MSEFLSAAASTMNVPETLVQRSAEARAKATGASVEDVLSAWAGGAAAPAAPAPAAPTESAPAPATDTAPDPESTVEPEAASAPAAAAAPAPSVVAVIELPPDEPVEPVPWRERARVGGRVGMGFGVLAAVFVMLFSAQWLLARSGSTQTEAGDTSFIFSVVPGTFILGSGLIGAAIGAAGAGFVRALTGWRAKGMRLVSSHASTILVGVVAGLVTGIVVAAVIAGSGSADIADETVTLVPMLPAILWTLLGWVGGGWLIGTLVHAMGVPDGLVSSEMTEGTLVRQRLGSAFSLPVVSVLAILVVVLPAAWVFIQFPGWAPLIAIFIAGGIISFAGLSAGRPGMRISAGEFLVAAGGIAVVIIILVAVLTTQGAGH